MIPNCQLSAEFLSSTGQEVPSLQHHVKLLGAKDPYDVFLIKPPAAVSRATATVADGIQYMSVHIHVNHSFTRKFQA